MPPHQKLDSYAGMAAQRSTTTQKDMGMAAQRTTTQKDMGRGATAGWVKCPLCPPRRQKRYARGRGLTAHLEAVHGSASLQEKTSAIARAETAPRTADRRGDGFTSTNEPPLACRLARDGDAVALIELLEATKGPLDPRHRDAHGYRPHHWAAGSPKGCLAALLELMPARRVDATTRCERIDRKRGGRTVLHWACRNGVSQNVALLLREDPASTELPTADGTTPLMLALYAASIESCDLLREAGARIQIHKNAWGCRDAHWAAMGADAGVALAWLRRHVSKRAWRDAIMEPQAQGHTVFHKAAQRGRRGAISRLLMEFEDDPDALMMALAVDDAGRTPSEIAAAAGHDDTAALLARAEAAVVVARRADAERRALRRRKAAIACVLVGLAALRRFRR